MIITHSDSNFKLNQINYRKIVHSINLKSIECDSCSHHDWSFHSSYYRYVDLLNRKVKIKISRIICNHCHKTHAILIEGMVPFSSLSHSDIINVLSSYDPGLVYSSHFYFLKHKYRSDDFMDYDRVCLLNCRSLPLIFVST